MKYKSNIKLTKDLFTSKYHGVRVDKRKDKTWYRANINLNNKKVDLGAYLEEDHAAHAFNIAASIFTNEHYIIWNKIYDKNKSIINYSNEVENKVIKLLIKKELITKTK